MNEEIGVFLDSLTEGAAPELLENVIKTKELIAEQNDKIKATELSLEEVKNTVAVQDEKIKSYEKMIAKYIKALPVGDVEVTPSPKEERSNYEEIMLNN